MNGEPAITNQAVHLASMGGGAEVMRLSSEIGLVSVYVHGVLGELILGMRVTVCRINQ